MRTLRTPPAQQLASKYPRIERVRDLHQLAAPVFKRSTLTLFGSIVLVPHECAAKTIVEAAFEHAILERVPE